MPENTAKVKGYLFGAVALGGAAAWFHPDVAGSDLWWHLAAGRAMWAVSALPCCDHFSFTFEGREWLNHEWLWDLASWPLFRANPTWLWLAHVSLLCAIFGLVYIRCRQACSSGIAASLTLWAVAGTTHWFLDIRPHLLTLLLLQLFLITRASTWAAWTWPALIAVWANLHAGFTFGLAAIGLHCVVESVRPRASTVPRNLRRLWIGVGLAVLCAGLNPWGYHIFVYPLSYLPGAQENPYRTLNEWRPPGLGWDELDVRGLGILLTFQTRFWLLATAAVIGGVIARVRTGAFLLILAIITLCMATTSRRFIPLFAVTAAPLVAVFAKACLDALGRPLARTRKPLLELGALAALTAAVAALWAGVRLFPDPLGRSTQRDLFPAAAARELARFDGRPRVFNHYSWGGFIMLHAPQARVFIDGRANTVYDEALLREFRAVTQREPGYETILERHQVEVALLPDDALARALRALPRPWRTLYQDGVGVLLAAPGYRPERLHAEEDGAKSRAAPPGSIQAAMQAQLLQRSARLAVTNQQFELAAEQLERALESDPISASCYLDLARVHALRGAPGDLRATLSRAERAIPRRRRQIATFAGELLLRLDRPDAARIALERGLGRGPFDDSRRQLQRIRSLGRSEPLSGRAPAS